MGAIRHFPELPGVDIRAKPTSRQLDIIEYEADNSPSGYSLEIQSPLKGRFFQGYDTGTMGSRVISDIKRYYGELVAFNLKRYVTGKQRNSN